MDHVVSFKYFLLCELFVDYFSFQHVTDPPPMSLLTEAKGNTEKSWLWIVTLEASACCHSFKFTLELLE